MRIEADLLAQLRAAQRSAGVSALSEPNGEANGVMTLRDGVTTINPLTLEGLVRKLEIDQNKLLVLLMLPMPILLELLRLMDKEQLLNGLMLFQKEILLKLILRLPKHYLLAMLMYLIDLEDLIGMMPTREHMAILRDDRLNERELLRFMENLPLKDLQFLLERLTGRSMTHLNKEQAMEKLGGYKKRQLMVVLPKLSGDSLGSLVLHVLKDRQELMMNISDAFIAQHMSRISKPQLIEAFNVLPQELIIERFMSQLPQEALAIVAAQLQTDVIINFLAQRHPEWLDRLAAQVDVLLAQAA